MSLQPGQDLLHYRIVERLGAGGMGEVFRATDTRLRRDVALKVLPAEAAARPEWLERFQREARAVASLSHPHIVTIHSVEEASAPEGGTPIHFITMELIEGRSLADVIPPGGMPLDDLLSLAVQLAEALAAAHDKGIVHRDLKPANVMVGADGQLKVLDFGLAKVEVTDDAGVDSDTPTEMLTREGAVMGTVPYMSPEQIAARPIDHRSDLFSLGTVLYEMACGKRPFGGRTGGELSSAILRDPPPPLTSSHGGLPARLTGVVRGCLEKDPADRIASAREVRDALEGLRSGGSMPDVPAPAEAAGHRRPFVGRDAERAEIERMLDEARRGHGGLVLLGGEPGVGKTCLAETLLAVGRERGMLAFKGHAYEEEGAPFITAVEILEDMTRQLPADALRRMLGDNASEMARLMPELCRRFPDIPEPIELPPEKQRRYLFNSVLEFLQRASGEAPMVMLFDDLHWADESSLLLLEHIAPQLPNMPLVCIGTYRDVELEVGKPFAKTRANLVRGNLARRISIRRFAEPDVHALIAALGGDDPPPELVTAIFRETEGNPFFVTEVYEHLVEEGLLFDDAGKWRADLDVSALDVPEGVRLVIGRRLERLDPATPKILAVAATIGLRFDLAVLEGAAGTDPDDVLDAIEEAEAARLVAPSEGSRAARYEFVHALVRQTLSNTLSVPRRQRTHLRVAEAMERAYAARLDERAGDIAHHLYHAGAAADPEKARHFLAIAARRSLQAGAAEEALTSIARALEQDDDLGDGERAELLCLRAEGFRTLGDWKGAATEWKSALPILEAGRRKNLVTHICWELAMQHLWRDETEQAREILERGLRAVGEDPSPGRCRMLSAMGHVMGNSGFHDEAERFNAAAEAMAVELGGDPHLLAKVLVARLYQYEHWLAPGIQYRTGKRAIELARRVEDPWLLVGVLGASTFGIMLSGHFDEFEAHHDELLTLGRRHGHHGAILHGLYGMGMLDVFRGHFDRAEVYLERSVHESDSADLPWTSITLAMIGMIRLCRGNVEGAIAIGEEAVGRELVRTWNGIERAIQLHVLVQLDPARASAALDGLRYRLPTAGQENPSGSWFAGMAAIEGALSTGDLETAAALYPCACDLLARDCRVLWIQGLMERLAGMAASAGGQWESAERHFETAARQARELPFRSEQSAVLRWHAEMLRRRDASGDRERAREMLEAARTGYSELGMPVHTRNVEALLRDGG